MVQVAFGHLKVFQDDKMGDNTDGFVNFEIPTFDSQTIKVLLLLLLFAHSLFEKLNGACSKTWSGELFIMFNTPYFYAQKVFLFMMELNKT